MKNTTDPFNLQRFVTAQNPLIDCVRSELRNGRKRSHWMWFVFPQIAGLGSSDHARWFAIHSLDEAKTYLSHPILGTRLHECTQLVLDIDGKTLGEIFGAPDDLKFRSSMTLFACAAGENSLFHAALKRYCGGLPDPLTLERL